MSKDLEKVTKELEALKKDYDKMFLEVLNTNLKLKSMGYLLKEFAINTPKFNFKEKDIIEVQSNVQEFIESIGLMMIDNSNTLQKIIDYEGSK